MDGIRLASATDATGMTEERASAERETGLAALAVAARDGDRTAGERLYEQARPRLLRLALSLGVDPDAAGDLVQDTLWAAHRALARFDPSRGSIEGWLATILVRRAHNRRRALARRLRLVDSFRRQGPKSTPPASGAVEARITLGRLLDSLTDRQRQVVALYEIGELGAEETSRILGLTPAGVRSIAHDARKRLGKAAREAGVFTEVRP
jgi:RNA polymerase sigma-70 factor (ECF subfamily)